MRIPVAVTLESRDGGVGKDAKVINGVVEPRGDSAVLRKRPGVSDLGQINAATGSAQLLYPWNGLWAISGDYLIFGTSSSMKSPSVATWSASDKGSNVSLSGSNLIATFTAASNVMVRATESRSAGKFYWEVTVTASAVLVGIAKSGATLNNFLGQDANGWAYQPSTGNKITGNVSSSYGASYTTGDVIGVALDCNAGTLTFYKNGVSQGTAFTGLSGTFFPAVSGNTSSTGTATVNFGATPFAFTPPTGYMSGLGLPISPTTAGLRFDAQEVGASAATQLMMIKNRTQAWTVTRGGTKTGVSFPSSMGAQTYSVTTLTRSGTTATASLATDPGVNIGDSITVAGASDAAYNVTANVTAVTPAVAGATVPISSLTRSGTTATAVTSAPHGLVSATTYTISGATQTAYNVSAAVTVVDSLTFTYTVTVTAYTAYSAAVTWNASDKDSHVTLSGGNLTATFAPAAASRAAVRATSGRSSGTRYWEVTITSGINLTVGVANATFPLTDFVGQDANSWGYSSSGSIYHSGSVVATGGSIATGDVIGFLLNMDSGTITFYKNGVPQGTLSGLTGTIYPAISASASAVMVGNFGATAAAYNYDDPASTATGSPAVTRPAVSAGVSYTVAGSPTSPASGTITLTTNGGIVPGLPYIDGYFFVMDNNGVMWQSAIDDPTSWPALSNLTAQNLNGKGKALNRSQNYLIAFKEWSTEYFYDAKVPNFSFLPGDNAFTEVGCSSGESVQHVDGSLIWVSQVKDRGRSVHVMNGLQQQKISTPDVERILNADDLATVHSYGLKLGGHSLYLLTLVTSNITLVYDLMTQAWTQWTSLTAGTPVSVSSITLNGSTATVTTSTAHGVRDGGPITIAGAGQSEYNGNFQITLISATSFSIHITGTPVSPATGTITATGYSASYFKFTKHCDYLGASLFLHETDGHLYQMLPTLYQDAGLPIDLFFRTTRLDGGTAEYKVMSRVGVVGDQISDTMILRYSDDDSATFSTYQRVDLSEVRPEIRRLGRFSRRTLEGRHIGNTSPRIEALEIDVQ
jgi:hypothetical protein